ncbi:MAG TPA: DUF433 domain-containing protein [Thermoanaerobaculia bacterium]|nr:DUF433 domain-containing protein [Thermoanaerobaculia bacterium]
MQAVSREHIEVTPGICGGRPRIAGHRIRVMDIVVLHEQRGLSFDEIVTTYPGLTLADIHAALAYYFDHREEIQENLARDRQLAAEMAREIPSRLPQKLRQSIGG